MAPPEGVAPVVGESTFGPGTVLTQLNHMAFVVSDEPGKVISVLLDLTCLEPYAFLADRVPNDGRALPIGRHVRQRELAGEGAASRSQLIHRLLGHVLAHITRGIMFIIVANREFARQFLPLLRLETWVIHPSYFGPMYKLARRPGRANAGCQVPSMHSRNRNTTTSGPSSSAVIIANLGCWLLPLTTRGRFWLPIAAHEDRARLA